MPMHFLFRPLPHVTSTPPWLLRPMRVSTSSELYPDTLLFFVFECLGIQFFNSLTCDLWDTMPLQRSPTLIPREAADFPKGDNHSKYGPLLTYLAWLDCNHYFFLLLVNSWQVNRIQSMCIYVKNSKI